MASGVSLAMSVHEDVDSVCEAEHHAHVVLNHDERLFVRDLPDQPHSQSISPRSRRRSAHREG
jgi:hypothetical protein